MSTCFIIQPFDRGPFDKRYADVIKPAIEAAGLEAYRVDEDLGASIPIDEIEKRIRESTICLADISTDNPNVWFELGYAIASRKEVVLVCSEERRAFPFDVQHRTIIQYRTDAPSDFKALGESVERRIKAILKKGEKMGAVSSSLAEVEGLDQHEVAALVALAENLASPGDSVSQYTIREDMERVGFTRIATFLALTALLQKSLVTSEEDTDFNDNPYISYRITEQGTAWLMQNESRLVLKEEPKQQYGYGGGIPDDDIPF